MVTKTKKRFPWGERVATPELIDEYVHGITCYDTGEEEIDKAAKDLAITWLKNHVELVEQVYEGREHVTMESIAQDSMPFLQGFNAGASYIIEMLHQPFLPHHTAQADGSL